MHIEKSHQLHKRAQEVIVGGVNSPSRSFRAVGGESPIYMKKAQGAYFWDVDGNRYIDYLAAFGPIILGHAHPQITAAIFSSSTNGILYGTPHELEILFAEQIRQAIPSMQQLRFVNSGTEAVMSTIRLARAFTGRDKIIKFAGCYHGHADLVLVAAGSGPSTLGTPDSAGIPQSIAQEVITIPYNQPQLLEEALQKWGDQIAAVLVEPLVGNFGIVPPASGFLESINRLAHAHGALVIYDEVITAFRFHYGGVQTLFDVEPDLTALGKIIGGGLPIGAYGGKKEIMEHVSPEGPMYQAGTMAGNPLSLAAGSACLSTLAQPGTYQRLEQMGTTLHDQILNLGRKFDIPLQVNQYGGAFTVYFTEQEVTDYETAKKSDDQQFAQFFQLLLQEGVYIAPSKYEAWFLTTAHTEQEIEMTILAIEKSFKQMKK
ncbi:glutamate-1-semialdehyde 2,1-aminomutase [Seinonella peptonophila]|uniref:Glutamate-1-semialdehyde 2,1-aminomutase n=1 Tax=Seinonella peptonophila TaxID=112248 RepID=A0A1M4ZJ53_9BACL|nr:glutamate-1-semialdehyde 2,1-aminomutase [Seinonella peptonophila]SHF18054.1 glutamate-1-semialdehyde 2,1-aminomutase [Seinonella peptonophila]